MVEKNGYKGYVFDVLLNIGADRMDITPSHANMTDYTPDFVIAYPKNFHRRVWRFSDALPSARSVYKCPCSVVV